MPQQDSQTRSLNHSFDAAGIASVYLQYIVQKRRIVYFVTFCSLIVGGIYVFFLPNVYTSKTMIVPVQEDKGITSSLIMSQLGGLAGLAGGSLAGSSQTDLYVTILKSDSIKDALIDRFKLMDVYRKKMRSDAYKELADNSVISAGKKDGVITISVEDKNPARAADIANAYAEELGKVTVRLSMTGAGKNRSFLEERLAGAKVDLARTEDALKSFQMKNKAVQVTSQAEASIKGIAELRAQLAAQEVKLATYRRQFTESSQEVKNLVASVKNLKAQIAKLEGTGEHGSIPSIGSLPAIGQEYLRLMRDYKVQETLVSLLTNQYEIARLSEAKDVPSFQVIDKARIADRKTKPRRLLTMACVTIYGFVLSILALLLECRFKGLRQSRVSISPEA